MLEKKQPEEFRLYLLSDEKSKNTIESYMRSIKIFLDKYGEINKSNMLEFKKWQLDQWKPKTAHNRIVALNQYCKFIGHPEYCVKNIKIHGSSNVENVITMEEYKKLLNGLRDDKNLKGYYMVQYLAKTGVRVSEFIRMEKECLETGYCEMWTKGKIRRIYIPIALIEESKAFFKNNKKYLFENRDDKQYTTRGISQNLQNWGKKYGIRKDVMHPHSFRHFYAINFMKRNNNIALLADLMGHSSVETTSIYLRLSKEEQKRQFNDAVNW